VYAPNTKPESSNFCIISCKNVRFNTLKAPAETYGGATPADCWYQPCRTRSPITIEAVKSSNLWCWSC
jgi:hypothetical protein